MVNLRAAGNQNITDVKFDESTQTLKVVGYIDQNEVNFNPLGTAMLHKATNGTAVFYAGYDVNGICKYVEIMDANGDEKSVAFDFYGSNVSMAGTFTGSPFQADPA